MRCGKCHNSIGVDSLTPSTYDLVDLSIHSPASYTNRESHNKVNTALESFILLNQSQLHLPANSSTPPAPAPAPTSTTLHLTNLTNLYNLISNHNSSKLDLPVCSECLNSLLLILGEQLAQLRKERDKLLQFHADFVKLRTASAAAATEGGITPKALLGKEIAKLHKAQVMAKVELGRLEQEKDALRAEMEELDKEEALLAQEETSFWNSHSEFLLKKGDYIDRNNFLINKYSHDLRELEKLEKTNVYNDTFCIGQEGSFGTINGLRLGKLSGVNVEWSEINAAWGHTLLLLVTIARKFGVEFKTYKLIPVGSFSKIERIADGVVWELYGTSEFHVTKLLQNRRFDLAMVAFLDCLKEVIEFVASNANRSGGGGRVPHLVNKDRIGDVSIKLQFGTEEIWTRALRHVLLDLKILLARAST